MKQIKSKKIHNTALLFILVAPFTVLFYASYVFNPAHMGNIWLYILELVADSIAIVNIAALWLTILLDIMQPVYYERSLVYDADWIVKNKLSVDVLITVTRE